MQGTGWTSSVSRDGDSSGNLPHCFSKMYGSWICTSSSPSCLQSNCVHCEAININLLLEFGQAKSMGIEVRNTKSANLKRLKIRPSELEALKAEARYDEPVGDFQCCTIFQAKTEVAKAEIVH